jgi:adenylate kinase family enzyme
MKISVIGYSSSGKSTFSKRLKTIYNIPLLHIDKIYFTKNWVERDPKIVENEVLEFSKQDHWIIDGLYRKIATNRFDDADQIFIFNFNRFKCLYGAIYRRIKFHNQVRDSIAEGCRERLNFSFIFWILFKGRTKKSKDLIKNFQKIYQNKVITFKSRKQANNYLTKIGYKGSFKYE